VLKNRIAMTRKKTRRPVPQVEPEAVVKSAAAPLALRRDEAEPTESIQHFFKAEDWLTALATTLISGLAFFYYMAPEVTLQDSGELVTGAFTFGVPHPPGYPLWAFLGFIWSHLIVPFGNPAWRIGMMSVVTGALTVGILTITMTRSLRLLLHALPWARAEDERLYHWMALFLSASTALLFGFNRGVWLWACVSEMRVLNQFSFVLTTCTFFAWTVQPNRRGFLYATLLLFAMSFANHQTSAVMAGPFTIGTLAVGLERFFELRRRGGGGAPVWRTLMICLADFWELVAAGGLCGMLGFAVLAWLQTPNASAMFQSHVLWRGLFLGGIGVIGLIAGRFTRWWRPRRALICAALVMGGIAFYLYMPLASSTNPPMNWGYASTKAGFLHAISRGQYEKMHTADVFSAEFLIKIKVFTMALIHQYSLPLCLLGLVTPIALGLLWKRCQPRGRAWMTFVWAAFIFTSLGLITIINPKLDRQEQEITIKFFAPAHGFYAMLIGYGLAVALSLPVWRRLWRADLLLRVICVALLALPLVTYKRNWSLCALRGYDFGYLFGYLMFNPGSGYEPMERDAVLYGGTDPGRFVPTYMIFCESRVAPKHRFRNQDFDRSDVYIITQNALADNTYMSYIRDHYDFSRPKNDRWLQRLLGRDRTFPREPIHIPSVDQSNLAFQEYIQGVQSGRIPASADVKIENGRVSVEGVGGVMAINGILARWIFDRNKEKHAFYVEESYVIPWMYPYLRPHGVIMQIEKEPLPAPQENPGLWTNLIARDRAYWDKLSAEFLARPDFRRNSDAKKSFSKLRSAIAGLFVARGLVGEAEYAFRQSLQLCPESPEANFRLADMYMRLRRYTEARALIEAYRLVDIYNRSATDFLNNIKGVEQADQRRQELERTATQGTVDLSVLLELVGLYQRLSMDAQFQALARHLLDSTNLPPAALMSVAQVCMDGQRWEMLEQALKRYLAAVPGDFRAWIHLGAAQIALNRPQEGFNALSRAVALGGDGAREVIRQDRRFAALQASPAFRALVIPAAAAFPADGSPAPRSLPY
jgi:tetratricopeptide (TPR) repeat protein